MSTSFPNGEPDEINGYLTRKTGEACDECGASADRWCYPDCKRLDLMDYR